MPDNGIGPMLTVREVARFLHVHSNTVRRWSDTGLIKSHRITHRGDRRFKQEDIVRFLTEMNKSRDYPSEINSHINMDRIVPVERGRSQ